LSSAERGSLLDKEVFSLVIALKCFAVSFLDIDAIFSLFDTCFLLRSEPGDEASPWSEYRLWLASKV